MVVALLCQIDVKRRIERPRQDQISRWVSPDENSVPSQLPKLLLVLQIATHRTRPGILSILVCCEKNQESFPASKILGIALAYLE